MEKDKQAVSGQDLVSSDKNAKKLDKKEGNPEVGGRGGLDPSRYGDWEIAGKCVDF